MLKKMISSMAVNALSIAAVIVISGGAIGLQYLIDIPSLLIALVMPFITTLIAFGPSQTVRSYSSVFSADDDETDLRQARVFFKTFARNIAVFTVFAVVTGSVMVLANIENTTIVGRSLAVALLSIFYGTAGAMIGVLPCIAEIDRRLAQ